jgi:plastocyanin
VYAGDPEKGNVFVDSVSRTPETTIQVGDTVQWINNNVQEHTIISVNKAPFDVLNPPLQGDIGAGETYSYTFNQVGNFGYYCSIHGGDPIAKKLMWGIVHVRPRS